LAAKVINALERGLMSKEKEYSSLSAEKSQDQRTQRGRHLSSLATLGTIIQLLPCLMATVKCSVEAKSARGFKVIAARRILFLEVGGKSSEPPERWTVGSGSRSCGSVKMTFEKLR